MLLWQRSDFSKLPKGHPFTKEDGDVDASSKRVGDVTIRIKCRRTWILDIPHNGMKFLLRAPAWRAFVIMDILSHDSGHE